MSTSKSFGATTRRSRTRPSFRRTEAPVPRRANQPCQTWAIASALTDRRADTGRRRELAAETRYVARGYRVVARNWRCRLGELDLVLARGPALVICEVKTRR